VLRAEAYSEGGLLISGGFHAPTGAEPHPWKEKKLSPPLDKFLNTPLAPRILK